MGNHCIDCEFCGQDRRVVGSNCCLERTKHDKEQADKQEAKKKADRDYLAHYGLNAYDGRLYASDVVAMLKSREGKILRGPYVGKPGTPRRFLVGETVTLKINPSVTGEVVKAGKSTLWFVCGNTRVGCTHAMVRGATE